MNLRSLLIIFVATCIILGGCQESVPKNPNIQIKNIPIKADTIVKVKTHDTITIAAVGDMMLGTSYPDNSKLPPDSAKSSFGAAISYFKGSDVIFGNLEGALYDSGKPATYKKNLKVAFLFRTPTYYGKVFKDAGFNLVSLANNHSTDFGVKGCESTAATLDKYGIHYAGLQTCPTVVFEKYGIKYGFCAFAPNANTMPLLEMKQASDTIKALKQRCNVLIVSFHGGAEGAAYEHVPFKMESFLGAKRGNVHAFTHKAIDAGADIVLGNGPHVSRALEKYKGRLIAYSLGNFCTYKSVSVAGVCGMAPLLKVKLSKKGEFISAQIISFTQSHQEGLSLDTLYHAAKRIKLLTEKDFPGSGLNISDNGEVMPVN
ncbi:MAG: CapA family protein [Sphingobacteriales bacterium]